MSRVATPLRVVESNARASGLSASQFAELMTITSRWAPGWEVRLQAADRLPDGSPADSPLAWLSHSRWGEWPALLIWRCPRGFCSGVVELDGFGNDTMTLLGQYSGLQAAVARARQWIDAYRDV
jgi:hypothetical protein